MTKFPVPRTATDATSDLRLSAANARHNFDIMSINIAQGEKKFPDIGSESEGDVEDTQILYLI